LSLRRICDKLKVKCPKCGYETERNLLSDHIPKCGKVEKSPIKQPINDRSGRPREVKNGKALTKIKWHRSRDRLNGRSRERLDGRGRSRSRDALDQIENRERHERGRSRSTENLLENSEPQFDLAREIERDIERINLAQEQATRESTVPNSSRRHRSIPLLNSQTTGRIPDTRSSSESSNLIPSRSNPDLNTAQPINISDLSDSSNEVQQEEQNYYSASQIQTRLFDIRIPLEEKLDYISGLSLVGGSDTPLKGIFIQAIHPDCSQYTKSIIREGDRVKKIQGRNIDQFTHSEAITLFSKVTRTSRELELQVERQTGFEVERTINLSIAKMPGQQVGIKLVTQQSQVRIFSVVPGSLAHMDGRLRNGDILLKVSNQRVRSSDEAAKEIVRVKNENVISLMVARTAKNTTAELPQRPHLVIPDQTASRQASTINSKSIDKVILFKKSLGESLGLGIAGGLGSLFGDLPVFVLDIKPGGRVSCDGRIRKGDLLISINNKTVSGLRHSQVVELLKDVARRETDIKIVVCEYQYRHRENEEKLSFLPNRASFCTWRHWLALPPKFLIYRETSVKRETMVQPLGLSIVGGEDQPVMVKYCTPGSVSATCSHLRSGDEILSINGTSVSQLNQNEIKNLLSTQNIRIVFLSWPGCLV